MLWFEQVLPHAMGFFLVLSRLGGLMLIAPVLSSEVIPRRVKVAFLLVLSAVVYPTIDHDTYSTIPLDLLTLAPLVASEMAVGATIGFIALIPIMSVQLAGLIMGQQLGLALAEQFNPALNISAENFGQLLFMTTMTSFIYLDGLEFLYASLVHTFAVLPAGGLHASITPVELLTGLVSSGFVIAMRIAMPVMAIILLETIAIGFIMKTVPALNILNVGFPIRILVGTTAFIGGLYAIKHTILIDLHETMVVIEGWVLSLSEGAPDA